MTHEFTGLARYKKLAYDDDGTGFYCSIFAAKYLKIQAGRDVSRVNEGTG